MGCGLGFSSSPYGPLKGLLDLSSKHLKRQEIEAASFIGPDPESVTESLLPCSIAKKSQSPDSREKGTHLTSR